jgi:hypothetical protein
MERARVIRSREQWLELVHQWESSGKYATVWCREQKISYDLFLLWRKRLKGTNNKTRSTFVELSDSHSAQSGIEIHYRNITITLCKDFDSVALCRCLQALEKI